MIKITVTALLLVLCGTALPQVQQRTYRDNMGRTTGRATTDQPRQHHLPRQHGTRRDARPPTSAATPPSATRWAARPAQQGASEVTQDTPLLVVSAKPFQEPAGAVIGARAPPVPIRKAR